MEKINVAELLRNCPSGMKLDSTLVGNLYFDCIDESELDDPFPIRCYTQNEAYRTSVRFNEYGHYALIDNSKCVIFPEGKTTWEGFVPPCQFKDGDILSYQCAGLRNRTIYIYRHHPTMNTSYYAALGGDLDFMVNRKEGYALSGNNTTARLATKDEKEKLFQAIKDKGYRWNEETKTLEKLNESKFKSGNWYQCIEDFFGKGVTFDKNTVYYCAKDGCLQDEYGCHIAIIKDLYDSFKLWTIQDAKDGDVLANDHHVLILKELVYDWSSNGTPYSVKAYCGIKPNGNFEIGKDNQCFCGTLHIHPATKEEKATLFPAIKENGYKWNAETKTLEKLNESKFKNGDILYCDANDDGEDKDMFKYIFIFDKIVDVDGTQFYYSHCHLFGSEFYTTETNLVNNYPVRFATEKEKQKLFQAIKDNGFRWNEETKTLEKLNESKFKNGDIVVDGSCGIFLYKGIHTYYEEPYADFYCGLTALLRNFIIKTAENQRCGKISYLRLATDEEKQELLDAIKKHGYYWNPETKTLKKLIEPEFNVGDKIRRKGDTRLTSIKEVRDNYYIITIPDYFDNSYITDKLLFSNQNEYELVPDKFDINTLVPFESRVLARDNDKEKWHPGIWGYYDSDSQGYPYRLIGDISRCCIPYEGNEHLRGKTEDCDKFYKTWEKTGD